MARRRSATIEESREDLEGLWEYYKGQVQEQRLSFLLFLKDNPSCTLADAADEAGMSLRSGERF